MIHIVLSGPSGVGKSTIADRLIKEGVCDRNISCTTRPQRPKELQGIDYDFVSDQQFHEMVKKGEFVEVKEIFGHLYGTRLKRIQDAKKPLLFVVDVDGMLSLKNAHIPIFTIFILPPDLETLKARLLLRGTNTEEEIARRLDRAQYEMTKKQLYDKQIINDDLNLCYKKVKESILHNETHS
ncbi:MAG: guanylate kinase [Chlamydiia bacterium]